LETVAPPVYQEGYDNAGLIVGDAALECTGVITCLDSTEDVVAEAVAKGCNLIVAHHPIVFKGLKRLTGRTYVERVLLAAIRNNIAIYAIHTNLDNVYAQGVNAKIAERLGLVNTRILAPKASVLRKATAYLGLAETDALKSALSALNTGPQTPAPLVRQLSLGTGAQGGVSIQLEVVYPTHLHGAVGKIFGNFSTTDVVYSEVSNLNPLVGSGMIGELARPLKEISFLQGLRKQLQTGCVKYTALRDEPVKTVAVCGGAGGFLLPHAIAAGAQVFVTADYKYHEFFDADGKIVIADVGHFESEQFTIDLLATIIREKFGNFAVHLTEVNTNPVNYL
jgi:dinuclear metal center YbgI/SA1388 family protein